MSTDLAELLLPLLFWWLAIVVGYVVLLLLLDALVTTYLRRRAARRHRAAEQARIQRDATAAVQRIGTAFLVAQDLIRDEVQTDRTGR